MNANKAKESLLTQDRLKSILLYYRHTGRFIWLVDAARNVKAGREAGRLSNGYVRITIGGNQFSAHRLAWVYVHGEWPTGSLDHINGNRSDNRIQNLRIANKFENGQNRCLNSNNKSGFTGVTRSGDKWRAAITIRGKFQHLGFFEDASDAANAYRTAKQKLHTFNPVMRDKHAIST